MGIDRLVKVIWLVIGAVILLGMLWIFGSIVHKDFRSHQHRPAGIDVLVGNESEKKYETKTLYEIPLFVEGSDYFVIPVSLKNVSKESAGYKYESSEDEYSGGGSYTEIDHIGYNYFDGPCHNLIFVHKATGQSEILLDKKVFINGVYFPEKNRLVTQSNEKVNSTFILLKLGSKDTSGDAILNAKDAMQGYLVGLDGKNLVQITPDGTDMGAWRYDSDSKKIFIQIVEDSNGDKKFNAGDRESILVVDSNAPGMGREFVSEEIKKNIEKVVH